jgi:hypothetical protein
MKLSSGLIISNSVDITKKVFCIETYSNEFIICDLENAYKIIKAKECFYLSYFVCGQLKNFSENDVIEMFENSVKNN